MELPRILETARKQFSSEKPPSNQDCAAYGDLLVILEGKKPAPKPEAVVAMSDIEKKDLVRSLRVFLDYCNKQNIESFLEVVKVNHDKECRTCIISSSRFTQSFRSLHDSSGRTVWVAQGNPEGVCGIVQLSRFEPEEIKVGNTTIVNWSYTARKAVTNPSGEVFPGMKCSRFDEVPYKYDWRSKERQVSCDYIQFSPI